MPSPEMPALKYNDFATRPHHVRELRCQQSDGPGKCNSAANKEASRLPKVKQTNCQTGQVTLFSQPLTLRTSSLHHFSQRTHYGTAMKCYRTRSGLFTG